jgi:hypothetical protein
VDHDGLRRLCGFLGLLQRLALHFQLPHPIVHAGRIPQTEMFRLNRGEWKDNQWSGFDVERSDVHTIANARHVFVNGVWLDSRAKEASAVQI